MTTERRPRLAFKAQAVALAVCACLVLVAGCEEPDQGVKVQRIDPPTSLPAGPGTHPATVASASPTASPPPDAAVQRTAVVEVAVRVLDARYLSPLTRDACLVDNPAGKICIELKTAEAAIGGGIARFAAGDPNGGGFSFYMGRKADGSWDYWFGTQQQTYVLEEPPGGLLACPAAAVIEIRREPRSDAAPVRNVDKLGELTAGRFVLTKAGSRQAAGDRGEGWYFVTSPVVGWVRAQEVTDAALSDCLLHDTIEKATRG